MAILAFTDKQSEIAEVFDSIINDVHTVVKERSHKSAVDIEINFNQVVVNEKKLLFTNKKEQSMMSIKLATTILPS